MLDQIRSWALSLCYAALCAGIVLMITPKNETIEKSIRFAAALFFLLCFFTPLTHLKNIKTSSLTESAYSNIQSNSVNENYLTNLESGLKLLIEKELERNGLHVKELSVELDTQTGGKVILDFGSSGNAEYLLAEGIIRDKFGLVTVKKDPDS